MMKKQFNITGACIPRKHYMVDISNKIAAIVKMIAQGDYFVINRPRQYGKTTILQLLNDQLLASQEYFPIDISFEGIGQEGFENSAIFIEEFFLLLKQALINSNREDLLDLLEIHPLPNRFSKLGLWIAEMVEKIGKKIILLIDEVDKSTNNQLFLDFLGMLRNKYLKREKKGEYTFHSVILAGVHDVKSLKIKLRPETEAKFNSPWNIAADFNVDLSFSTEEICTMLKAYSKTQDVTLDIPALAYKLFFLTSGYPFLVSLLCKIIDETLLPAKETRIWQEEDVEKALQISLKMDNTNFESLIRNLENNPDLYELVQKLIMDGSEISFNQDNPLILFGKMYGIFKNEKGSLKIHNRVYEQRIYNYLTSKLEISRPTTFPPFASNYLDNNGGLDIEKVLGKFQNFMKEHYSEKNRDFIERNGALLFLAFIRPILNGRGFDFKEVQISEERRLDVVITFNNRKYIIELKIWRGESYHQEGLRQLAQYLNMQNQKAGFLLIFDLRKESEQAGKMATFEITGKTILAAWV